MLCRKCQAPIIRGSLAAKTRHGHILHATCYRSQRPHAGSYPSTNMRMPQAPQPRRYPPTQPPPIRHQARYPPHPPRLYRQYPVQTAPHTPRSVSDNSSDLSDVSVNMSQTSNSPPPSPPISPPPSPPPTAVEKEVMPLEGGGLTPFNLKLEGGGHKSSPSSQSFEIDVFMK